MSLPTWDESMHRGQKADDVAQHDELYMEGPRRQNNSHEESSYDAPSSQIDQRYYQASTSDEQILQSVGMRGMNSESTPHHTRVIKPNTYVSKTGSAEVWGTGIDESIYPSRFDHSYRDGAYANENTDGNRHPSSQYHHNHSSKGENPLRHDRSRVFEKPPERHDHQYQEHQMDSRRDGNMGRNGYNEKSVDISGHSSQQFRSEHPTLHNRATGTGTGDASFHRNNLSDYDDLRFRETCLRAAEDVKHASDYLDKIQAHVNQEASLSVEAMSSIASLAFPYGHPSKPRRFTGANNSAFLQETQHAPKEAIVLNSSTAALQDKVVACIKSLAECLETRKGLYLGQLKKIREISNMATRNAVQNERAQQLSVITRLRNTMEQEHKKHVADLAARNTLLEKENASLQKSIEEIQGKVKGLVDSEQNRVALQNQAVHEAVERQRAESEAERAARKEATEAEVQRMHAEYLARADDLNAQHQAQLVTQKEHDEELRRLLTTDKERAEKECELMRKQVLDATKQLTSEKEKAAVLLREEVDRSERRQQEALAEAVKEQARLKADMAAMLQRLKAEEERRRREQEVKVAKFREGLLASHAMEVEKLNDRHRSEMKKFQAELQVRSQEAMAKMKQLQSQEIARLIRENERLQRLVVRNGGADLFRPSSTAPPPGSGSRSTSYGRSSSEGGRSGNRWDGGSSRGGGGGENQSQANYSISLSPPKPPGPQQHKQQQRSIQQRSVAFAEERDDDDDDDEHEPPPPPPPSSSSTALPPRSDSSRHHRHESQVQRAGTEQSNGLNWGALQASLAMQDAAFGSSSTSHGGGRGRGGGDDQQGPRGERGVPGRPRFSADYMPPDPFPLDESVASAKLSPLSTKLSRGIETNAVRVGNYMTKLEDYLQGNVGSLNVSFDGEMNTHRGGGSSGTGVGDYEDVRNSSADEDSSLNVDNVGDVSSRIDHYRDRMDRNNSSGTSSSAMDTSDSNSNSAHNNDASGGLDSSRMSFGAHADAQYRATKSKYGLDSSSSAASGSRSGSSGIPDSVDPAGGIGEDDSLLGGNLL